MTTTTIRTLRYCSALFLFAATSATLVASPLLFEPFAPAITAYNVDSLVAGQTNAQGLTWASAGPSGSVCIINASNLNVTGLAASTGNSITFGVSTGPSVRIKLTNSASLPDGTNTGGSVYYSMAFRVDDIGALSTNGGFFAAFNNSIGAQTTTPSLVAACTQLRLATNSATSFNVGIKKDSAGSVYDTNVFQVGDTVFVVASYTYSLAATNDDVASIWINPNPSTFGAASPPTPTITTISTVVADYTNGIASFCFFRRGSGSSTLEPAAMVADELRVGTNWADVTPPAGSASVLLSVSLSGGNVILSWPTNSSGFRLQGVNSLVSGSNAWTNVTAPTNTVGTNFSVTDPLAGKNYYRLISP